MCLIAVAIDGYNLQCVKKQDRELCFVAVSQDGEAI